MTHVTDSGVSQLANPVHSFLEARSSIVAAENAFKHLERKSSVIDKIFSSYGIPESNYGISAGFDQTFPKCWLGHREEIHIFIHSGKKSKCAIKSLLSKLGSIISPFPGIVFKTVASEPHSVITLPATNSPTYSEIVPIAISSTAYTLRGQSDDVGLQGGKGNKIRDGEGDQLGLGSRPPGGEGDLVKHFNAEVTIDVNAEICASPPGQVDREVTQRFCTNGKFAIKCSSEGKELRQFPTCFVEFQYLRFDNARKPEMPTPYSHLMTTVAIDVQSRLVVLDKLRPERAKPYKATTTSPTGDTGEEKFVNVVDVTETDIRGGIEWNFLVAEGNEMDGGRIIDADYLPMADYLYVGANDTPAPPPPTIDLQVSSFWSLLDARTIESRTTVCRGKKPFYSNVSQINVMKIPSDLEGKYSYSAELPAFPKQTLNIQQNTAPIGATVGIKNVTDAKKTTRVQNVELSKQGLSQGRSEIWRH